ncbi:S1 RNA-binding domain-containing protein [Pseudothermotoga thermarum]|uniref:RNA binding S1 domain protein n=1 Tax=Pseudothermotoga thermarum DSM 5069 TaxID=688269 RepID=F7YU71_9THEM|nr:S1 RNA-binding domain-containing protein [Pseudothermotoga thermarum]AEH50167.1 RNA binding S1 domain protein [Pseudothermotoga thermarum DSM 5069]
MTKVGDIVKSKVTQITKYGAMVTLENGEPGFIHISKISNQYVKNVADFLKEGQEVEARVIGKTKDGKWELSLKDQKVDEDQQKAAAKAEFERKLAKFLRDSEKKFAEYKKRAEKKGGRF